jgi:hypothetical protein
LWCAVCGVRCAVCGVWCAVCSVQCVVCGVRCAVCGVRCAVCSVRCAVCGVWCVVCIALSIGGFVPVSLSVASPYLVPALTCRVCFSPTNPRVPSCFSLTPTPSRYENNTHIFQQVQVANASKYTLTFDSASRTEGGCVGDHSITRPAPITSTHTLAQGSPPPPPLPALFAPKRAVTLR